MDNTPRSQADTKRRLIEAGAKPVLARLPDVSSDLLRQRPGKSSAGGNVGYRFDPPQTADRGPRAADGNQPAQNATLKSELVYAPQASRPPQPHVFERNRLAERPARLPRRESPVLPRSNPFSIPQRGLLESVTPVLRFVTLVALFAAAGTWIQLSGIRNRPASGNESPKTTAEQPGAPSTKTVDRPMQLPTAVGPVGSTPEAGTRVGRVRDNDDFAKLRGDIIPITPSTGEATGPSLPSLAGTGGVELPRVQTTEISQGAVGDDPAHSGVTARANSSTRPPEVAARVPGFIIAVPSR